MSKTYKLSDVFGVSREIPQTYVSRTYVDGEFTDNLSRDKHIVIYGGSKQGKTCLRKKCLNANRHISVQCGSIETKAQIYEMILKEAGARIEVTEKKTIHGGFKIGAEIEAKGKIPMFAEASGKASGEYEREKETEKEFKRIEIDPADPNDIIRLLSAMEFDKYIVLEDFHYLTEDVQREVAIDLKAFHEKSKLIFIVVGVWVESNRLVLYNGDLSGRMMPVNADNWQNIDLHRVIADGERLLNFDFDKSVREEIVEQCHGNVGILQETCYRICKRYDVRETLHDKRTIGDLSDVPDIIRQIGLEQSSRYRSFLLHFVEGFQTTELEMYKWIAYILIKSSSVELRKGLQLRTIFQRMKEVHPARAGRLLQNNVRQALSNVRKLQAQHEVRPFILDFDSNENTLRIVDSEFTLYLEAADKDELIELVGCEEAADPSTPANGDGAA